MNQKKNFLSVIVLAFIQVFYFRYMKTQGDYSFVFIAGFSGNNIGALDICAVWLVDLALVINFSSIYDFYVLDYGEIIIPRKKRRSSFLNTILEKGIYNMFVLFFILFFLNGVFFAEQIPEMNQSFVLCGIDTLMNYFIILEVVLLFRFLLSDVSAIVIPTVSLLICENLYWNNYAIIEKKFFSLCGEFQIYKLVAILFLYVLLRLKIKKKDF